MMKSSKTIAFSLLCALFLLAACQGQEKQASKPSPASQVTKIEKRSTPKTSNTSKPNSTKSETQMSSQKSEQDSGASKQGNLSASTSGPAEAKPAETSPGTDYEEVTKRSSKLDIQAIASGDFTTMVGTWTDVDGKSFVFDNQGLVSETSELVFRSQDRAILYFDLRDKVSGSGAAFMIIQAGGSAPGGRTYGNDVIIAGHDVSAETKPFYHERDLGKVEGQGSAGPSSGTLELSKDTPVYAEPNKAGGSVFAYPKGKVNWDSYLTDVNADNWYSYLSHGGQRYYIAYSDVGH